MNHRRPARSLAGAALFAAILPALFALSAVPARGGTFYDATLDLGLRDDTRIFLNVTHDYFRPAPAVGVELVRRCPVPEDDFPVVLLLARAARRPAEDVLRLRLDYLSWSDIMVRLNVAPAVLFAGLDRDPGPPYGRAWGYWKKNPRGEAPRDRDVVELAKLQIAASSQRVSPYAVIAERNKGTSVERWVAGKNGHKYPGPHASTEPGRGHGHASEKTKKHGHNDH